MFDFFSIWFFHAFIEMEMYTGEYDITEAKTVY